MSDSDTHLRVENIGGIDDATISLPSGVTVLEGRNATNRTSLLRALNAALGGSMGRPNSEVGEGSAILSLAGTEYKRQVRMDRDGNLSFSGSPLTDEEDVVDLFATLTGDNPIRAAVERAGSTEELNEQLREMLMAPVDDEALRAQARERRRERDEVEVELEAIQETKERLTELEQDRTVLREQLQEAEERLAAKRTAIDEANTDKERSQEAQNLLDELEAAEREEERLRNNLQKAKTALATAREEREHTAERIDELEAALADTAESDETLLADLREQRNRLQDAVALLRQIQRTNREALEQRDLLTEKLGVETEDVLDQLTGDSAEIECWACGSVVSEARLESRIEELKGIGGSYRDDIQAVDERIERVQDRVQERERLQGDLQEANSTLVDYDESIERYESQVAQYEEELADQREVVEDLKTRVEATEDLRDNQILDLHEEVRDLSREQGRLERELERVEADIKQAKEEIAKEDDLRKQKANLEEEIASLRGRIEQLETTAVDVLQEYLDDLVDLLDYQNIARVRVDQVKRDDNTTSEFRLAIVRNGTDGAREEPQGQGLQTLSESERSLIGVVVALAGYRTHNVGDTVPILLLDSIEEFDSERIGRLVDYIADNVPRVVCALLPEDTDRVQTTATVSAAQLGAE